MMERTYFTDFGGSSNSAVEEPDTLNVLNPPNNNTPIGTARRVDRTPEGLPVYRLVVGGKEVPGRWARLNRRFVPEEG